MPTITRKANIALWIAQGLLAALFLFSGGFKLLASTASLTQSMPPQVAAIFSPTFLRFIGISELLGGLGLILPGIFQVATSITPLAAAGLTIIMAGATISTALTIGVLFAITPLVVGSIAAAIARSRWPRTHSIAGASRIRPALHATGGQ